MPQNLRSIAGSLLFAALWIAVAAFRPTSTFHLAPLIVAAWPALRERGLERAIRNALAGGLVAGVATASLWGTNLLQGPSLLPWGGPVFESFVAAAIGTVLGILPSVVARMTASEG